MENLRAASCGLLLFVVCSAFAQEVPVVQAVASSEQAGYLGPQNVISNDGLTEDPPGSGNYRYSNSSIDYNSSYGTPNDESPLIHFDFGTKRTIGSFRVWNANGTGYNWRGFRGVTIQYSNDAEVWRTMPERMTFAKGPATSDYFGELKTLPRSIHARYIRFCCNSTWRDFGGTDIASLGRVKFYTGTGTTPEPYPGPNPPFPADAGVINVKLAPYLAKGDGVTDDTAAIQAAINDWQGQDRLIVLPEGTYLVSDTLRFAANTTTNRNWIYGRNHLIGQGKGTVIRLKDNTFTNVSTPKPVIANGLISFWNGSFEQITADWFNNSIADLTIHTGTGNPGAVGIEFYSNNTGVARNLRIISGDGTGVIGLDLAHADLNGPLLAKNIFVSGFSTGIRTGQTVNSQTLEDITLINQSVTALDNNGQCIAIRNLRTSGPAQGFLNRYGFATIVDSQFNGTGAASTLSAISNGEFLTARNISVTGFSQAIQNNHGTGPNVPASFTGDYLSHPSTITLFSGTATTSLNLPVQPTVYAEAEAANRWVNIRNYRRTNETDDSGAFQRAIDTKATTLYFPADASIVLKSDVIVRRRAQTIYGLHANIQQVNGAKVIVSSGVPATVVFERLKGITIEHAATRGVSVIDSEVSLQGTSTGDVFLDNVGGSFALGAQNVWARQLNSEPEGLKITNTGGNLWILGLKTERAGTLVQTTNGGSTEIIGSLCYTTTNGTDPMFTVVDSRLSVSIAEVAYGPNPYGILVRETRSGVTQELLRGGAPFRFSFMNGSAIPLFRAGN
jgi:polygalacturonase